MSETYNTQFIVLRDNKLDPAYDTSAADERTARLNAFKEQGSKFLHYTAIHTMDKLLKMSDDIHNTHNRVLWRDKVGLPALMGSTVEVTPVGQGRNSLGQFS